jgi:hypothetical protein
MPEMHTLGILGFQNFCVVSEIHSPFSFFVWLPIYLVGQKFYQAQMSIASPLRFGVSAPVMVCPKTCCFGIPQILNMPKPFSEPRLRGVKYYTQFMDGTTIISANVLTKPIIDTSSGCYKYQDKGLTLEQCYQRHQERVQTYIQQDRWLNHDLSCENLIRMSQLEDQAVSGKAWHKQKSKEI